MSVNVYSEQGEHGTEALGDSAGKEGKGIEPPEVKRPQCGSDKESHENVIFQTKDRSWSIDFPIFPRRSLFCISHCVVECTKRTNPPAEEATHEKRHYDNDNRQDHPGVKRPIGEYGSQRNERIEPEENIHRICRYPSGSAHDEEEKKKPEKKRLINDAYMPAVHALDTTTGSRLRQSTRPTPLSAASPILGISEPHRPMSSAAQESNAT